MIRYKLFIIKLMEKFNHIKNLLATTLIFAFLSTNNNDQNKNVQGVQINNFDMLDNYYTMRMMDKQE